MGDRQVEVSVLGKGQEKVTISPTDTVGSLRKLLALDSDVLAANDKGKTLKDSDQVPDMLSFAPNIEGGM